MQGDSLPCSGAKVCNGAHGITVSNLCYFVISLEATSITPTTMQYMKTYSDGISRITVIGLF